MKRNQMDSARSRVAYSGARGYYRRGACALVGMSALCAGTAWAADIDLGNGVQGNWSLNASIGTSRRVSDADPALIVVGNGGTAGSSHDDGELNYRKNDPFSTIAKVVGELTLKRGNVGVFVRAKGWYDYELSKNGVPHGSAANGYAPGATLNDQDFHRLSQFSGVALLDAYAYLNSDIAGYPVTAKVGNQVVNWGESLFVPGINQFGAFDISAARRPGSQLKEVLLPIPQIAVNVGLTDSLSIEAFYQLAWKHNILDGCGTYWSVSDAYNCSDKGVNVPAGPLALQTDRALFTSGIARMANAGELHPSDSGQWGLAGRYFSDELATEFGAYFVNYHQRSPVISIRFNASPPPSAFSAATNRLQYQWDWSSENIKVAGLSFSTGIAGWSVFGEFSHTKDFPVQLNGLDLIRGASAGVGPLGFLAATPRNVNALMHGYDLKNKNQFQVSTLKSFPRKLGAESLNLIGEVVLQKWSGIGDPNTGRRYGRAFVFGQATTSTLTNCTAGGAAGAGNANSSYCENEGFATSFAWGLRAQAELSYPNLFAGVNFKPRLFLAADVKGYSADANLLEDRRVLGIGARFDYLSKYYADISYNRYNHNAKYDTFHDRDFASVVVGVNF